MSNSFPVPTTYAVQSVPYKMNFQGKITDSSGFGMAPGNYNMKFRIYNAASGGTLLWSEQRANSAGTGVAVTAGGLFSVRLGDVSALSPSTFNNASDIYFEVELPTPGTATCTGASCESYTEGPMTPRSPLGASAYSFNSDTLDGLDSSTFSQLGANNSFTGTNSVSVNSTSAFSVVNGSSVFAVDTTNSRVSVGAADSTGSLFVLDTKNTAGDPTAVNGGMYYNSNTNRLRCAQASVWTNCISDLQGAYDAAATGTITTTSAKGIKVAAGAAPTADMFTVDNTGQAVTTAGVSGVQVTYVGGAGAIEASGMRVDFTPGTTSGSTWNGMRIVASATGAVSGVQENGLKLEGPATPGAGTEVGVSIGTGWDIGADIQSGGLQLAVQNDPSAPAAGNLRIYAKDIAGRVMPKWVAPSGVDTPLQANLGFNRVAMVMPAGGTALTTFVSGFGTTFTNAGTAANPTPTSTNHLTSVRRATFSTGATAGTVASHRQGTLQVWRGNAAGRGGFFYTIRFGTSSLVAGNRGFVGLADVVTTAPTNVDPLTNATPGRVGVAFNTNTGNWRFINNISGSAPTVADLGSSLPLNTTDLYELVLYSAPNGSSIGYRLKNITTGAQATGSVSTNIPNTTTFLSPMHWITNNATAAAAILDFSGWYLESDN